MSGAHPIAPDTSPATELPRADEDPSRTNAFQFNVAVLLHHFHGLERFKHLFSPVLFLGEPGGPPFIDALVNRGLLGDLSAMVLSRTRR